jgi:hypothetical protein
MRERGILFSAPMVRAILSGAKTQTRRVVRPQPSSQPFLSTVEAGRWHWCDGVRSTGPGIFDPSAKCPFGARDDRLWVRETFVRVHDEVLYRADLMPEQRQEEREVLRIAKSDYPWRPAIYMPRWASRLTLEVTDLRVERVADISEQDARAEGALAAISEIDDPRASDRTAERWALWTLRTDPGSCVGTARGAFASLWERINGKRPGCAWSDNPWVWAISFRRIAPLQLSRESEQEARP